MQLLFPVVAARCARPSAKRLVETHAHQRMMNDFPALLLGPAGHLEGAWVRLLTEANLGDLPPADRLNVDAHLGFSFKILKIFPSDLLWA